MPTRICAYALWLVLRAAIFARLVCLSTVDCGCTIVYAVYNGNGKAAAPVDRHRPSRQLSLQGLCHGQPGLQPPTELSHHTRTVRSSGLLRTLRTRTYCTLAGVELFSLLSHYCSHPQSGHARAHDPILYSCQSQSTNVHDAGISYTTKPQPKMVRLGVDANG